MRGYNFTISDDRTFIQSKLLEDSEVIASFDVLYLICVEDGDILDYRCSGEFKDLRVLISEFENVMNVKFLPGAIFLLRKKSPEIEKYLHDKTKRRCKLPISKKQFLTGSWKKDAAESEDYVLAFLKQNEHKAYKAEELMKALNKSESSIRQKLQVLVKSGLVTRDSPYYIYGKHRLVKKAGKSKKSRK